MSTYYSLTGAFARVSFADEDSEMQLKASTKTILNEDAFKGTVCSEFSGVVANCNLLNTPSADSSL